MDDRMTLAKLEALVGTELDVSDWLVMTQERIHAFAECTEDRQWIHVDPERAAQSPLKSTVAHGFLILSLLTHWDGRPPRGQGQGDFAHPGQGHQYGRDRGLRKAGLDGRNAGGLLYLKPMGRRPGLPNRITGKIMLAL
jgi:hypothetical protein